MNVKTLIEISSGQITTYVNLGLVVIGVLVLIGFLIGLAKGVWKKTFAVVFFVVSFLCLILFIKPLGNFIYGYDITQITNAFNISLPDSIAESKTIGQLVYDQIEQIIVNSNMNITLDAESIKIIDGLALSVIQLVLFIIGVVLIFILGSLFCPLLYHLIFKWIIPKRVRNEHKVRILGGLMGMVETICILSMLLVPFSALVNTVAIGTKDVEKNTQSTNSDNEIYNLVTSILEGYNNSILAKALFAVTIDGKPIDIKLMDYIMDNKNLNENNIHLLDEIQNLSSVALDGIAKGVISLADGSINYSVLLESEFVKGALYTLSDSSLICTVLPIALTIGLNVVDEKTEYDFTSVNFDDVDWSDSIRCVGDVFDEIRETGIVTEDSIQDPKIMLERIKLDRSYEAQFSSALSRLGGSDFAKIIMPQMVTSYLTSIREVPNTSSVNKKMANNDNEENKFSKFTDYLKDLPDQAYEVETYQSIDWAKELVDLLEIAFDISDQVNIQRNEPVSLKDISTLLTIENMTDTFFGIDGERKYLNANDYKNNVFVNGGTIDNKNFDGTKAIFGCSTKEGSKGILDLQIVNKLLINHNALPKIIRTIAKEFEEKVPNEYINDACNKLSDEVKNWKLDDWKKEVSNLIDNAVPLVNASSFIVEGDNDRTIENLCEGEGNFALQYFADSVDNSFILSEVAPLAMEAYCHDEKNDRKLFLNIKLSDLNFTQFDKDTSFGKEFAFIADEVLPKAKTILDISKSEKVDVNTIIDNNEDLTSILECAYQSQILNRKLTEEEIKNDQINNFQSIMIDLLTEPTKEQLDQGFDTSLNIPTITDKLVIVDKKTILGIGKNGNPDWVEEDGNGEIKSLVDVICSLRKDKESDTEYLLSYINDKNSVDIEEKIYEMGNEVERVFKEIDDSQLMRDAFPEALNTMIKDIAQFDKGVDFENVNDWIREGIEFRETLDKLNELKQKNNETDIATLLKNCDKDVLKEYQFELPENKEIRSQYHNNYYEYFEKNSNAYELMGYIHETESINLPEVIYSAVEEVLANVDNDTESLVSKETLENAKEDDFLFEDNTIKYNNEINVNWNMAKKDYYRGEIYNVARLLSFSDSLSKLNELDNKNEFNEILEVTNNTYIVRSLLSEIFDNSFEKMCNDENQSDVVKSVFGSEHADYGAFGRLDMNYREDDDLEFRVNEINARSKEFDVISELNTRENDLNKLNEEGKFDESIKDLTDGGENSKLTSLLTKLHDSKIFNSVDHVSKNIKPGEVRKYTSFENMINEFFKSDENSGNSMLKPLSSDELFALDNREENDKWVKNGDDVGEIIKFNNSINNAITSEIYTTVVKSDAENKLDVIKSMYSSDKPDNSKDHLETFSTNLSNSYLLELQLPHIYDEYIYKSLKDSAPKGDNKEVLDHTYYLLDTPYEQYHEKTKVDWANEGATIDDLLIQLNNDNLDFNNVGDVDSDQIDSLLTSLRNSNVLAYDSSSPFSENKDERSFYEYIICSIDSNITTKIYKNNTFEIEDVDNQRSWITTKDIKYFDNEKEFVVAFMASYDQLKGEKPYDNNGSKYPFIDKDDNFVDISTLDEEKIDGLIIILDNLFESLYQSESFNFRNLNSEEYHIKGEDYLNRTTYEHGIICLSNKIRTAICDNLSLKELDGYRINNQSSNYLNTNSQFRFEQGQLINVLGEYKDVVGPMNSFNNIGSNPVTIINENRKEISDLFNSISYSLILNDTNDANNSNSLIQLSKGTNPSDSSEENYLSLYDDIVIYVLNETNKTIYDSLKFNANKNTMSISDIKIKKLMKNQDTYDDELNNIVGANGIAYYADKLGLNKGDVTFDINFISNEGNKVNVKELLKSLESSYCFNFTKSVGEYVGRESNSILEYESNMSTFEKIALNIFAQDSFNGRIYDEGNPNHDAIKNVSDNSSLNKDKLVVVNKIMDINKMKNEGYIDGVSFFADGNNGEFDKLFDLFDDLGEKDGYKELELGSLNEGKEILDKLGKIYILHDIEPKQIRELSTSQSISAGGGMNSINDACIVNSPTYYYYENRDTYKTFNSCAGSYVTEINTIIDLLNIAKESNVSGDINTIKVNEESRVFENLLTKIKDSNIFRPISSDIVVKIFNQIQNVTPTKTWCCDYFINNEENDISGKNIKIKVNHVTENFNILNTKYSDIYLSEGEAFDKFLNYAIKRIKGEVTPNIDISGSQIIHDLLIGDQMIKNFDKKLNGLI